MNQNSIKASPLIQQFADKDLKGNALEIGFGYGDNAIFLAQNDFLVTAVDVKSKTVENLRARAEKESVSLEIICSDIVVFPIKRNYYSFISAMNVLNFVSEKEFFEVIENIKNGLKENGICIISLFTVEDDRFKEVREKTDGKFYNEMGGKWFFPKPNQLKEIFEKDFSILFYKEVIVNDNGHFGKKESHEHAVARIVVKKGSTNV